jgi:NAD(P)-dependent dehydrogenase (short-subunit alcohol dehydrogenase family)
MSDPVFLNRTAVVTNATSDWRFGIARRLAHAGAHVVIAASDAEVGKHSAEILQEEGLSASFFPLDARDPAQSVALVDALVRKQTPIDVWVNCCHEFPKAEPAAVLSQERWGEVLQMSLCGTFYCSQAAGREMLARGRGVIVNVTSSLGVRPIDGGVASSVAEAGVMMLTQALGIEWARQGVRVVGVTIGDLMSAEAPLRRIPLKRSVTAEEVAETVLYLASDEAAHIVAETLRADGGWSTYQLF